MSKQDIKEITQIIRLGCKIKRLKIECGEGLYRNRKIKEKLCPWR